MSDGFHQSPFEAVREFLDGRKYTYAASEQNQRIGLSMCGKHADYRFVLRITNDGGFFQITANYPFRVRDARMRPSVAELLTRANYAMLLGKFEMDMEDGEIRFHLSQLIEEGQLAVSTVEKLFLTCLHTLDRYFPALMQHLHAGYTPGDAIFHAEFDIHAEQAVLNPPSAPAVPPSPEAEVAEETPEDSPAAPAAEGSQEQAIEQAPDIVSETSPDTSLESANGEVTEDVPGTPEERSAEETPEKAVTGSAGQEGAPARPEKLEPTDEESMAKSSGPVGEAASEESAISPSEPQEVTPQSSGEIPRELARKGEASKSRRLAKRKVSGTENHPELPF